MIKDGYDEIFEIKYSDKDQNLALKPFALLNYLQDIAVNNAEDMGFGYSYMTPRHLGWYLIKYRMEFIKYPVNLEKIKVRTKSRGYNKLFAYRDFELYVEDELIARIASLWAIVNFDTKSMLPIVSVFEGFDNLGPYEKEDDDLIFSKLKASDAPQNTKEFEVRYDDIDTNGHANNGHYIVWALETLDFDFRSKHTIKTIDMYFKKEACYGEKILSELTFKDNLNTLHVLKNENNEELLLLECTWN